MTLPKNREGKGTKIDRLPTLNEGPLERREMLKNKSGFNTLLESMKPTNEKRKLKNLINRMNQEAIFPAELQMEIDQVLFGLAADEAEEENDNND